MNLIFSGRLKRRKVGAADGFSEMEDLPSSLKTPSKTRHFAFRLGVVALIASRAIITENNSGWQISFGTKIINTFNMGKTSAYFLLCALAITACFFIGLHVVSQPIFRELFYSRNFCYVE